MVTRTKRRLSEEFWFKFPELKAKSQPKKRASDGDESDGFYKVLVKIMKII